MNNDSEPEEAQENAPEEAKETAPEPVQENAPKVHLSKIKYQIPAHATEGRSKTRDIGTLHTTEDTEGR